MRILIPLLVLTSACCEWVSAGPDTLHVCGVDLQLGETKEQVFETSSACSFKRLVGTQTDDSWLAFEKGTSHVLGFRNGFLSFVEKRILHDPDDTSAEMVSRVFAFIRDATSQNRSVTFSIGPSEGDLDTMRIRSVTFTAGDKSITMRSVQRIGVGGSDVETGTDLTESLLYFSK
jgi:hypothetical protein